MNSNTVAVKHDHQVKFLQPEALELLRALELYDLGFLALEVWRFGEFYSFEASAPELYNVRSLPLELWKFD